MEMLVTGIQFCDFYVWINSDNLQMIIEIINKKNFCLQATFTRAYHQVLYKTKSKR